MSKRITNIFCIGRNYAEHANELGNAVPKEPVVFLKPTTAFIDAPTEWKLPLVGRVDFEAELVLSIGSTVSDRPADLWSVVDAVGIGIDFTARSLQTEAKQKGLPWLAAKGRKHFAPVSKLVPVRTSGTGPFHLHLTVNGATRQQASTSEMVFPIPLVLEHLIALYGLTEGDLVFTGTPAGVGPVQVGDRLVAQLGDSRKTLTQLDFKVV